MHPSPKHEGTSKNPKKLLCSNKRQHIVGFNLVSVFWEVERNFSASTHKPRMMNALKNIWSGVLKLSDCS